ncbi:TonB-dependent receptor plug domain-containing protein [Sphingobium fuliginis]|uniref:TonB-dependent receptor n=1 Tax=Sphingobium fuliginis ATCC 27551 TaxID=1208342 RepID=A0A5B8CN04_SPHSA|nr:TonB-dependent receptor [Sphingobium fuliginis]QDC40027.1 TonB-dependent receptor [Sphingobium fuliginis ATCC 27551]
MRTNSAIIHRALCNSSALTVCLASLSLIAPAAAQSSTAQQSDTQTAPGQAPAPTTNSAEPSEGDTIVVTGSILRTTTAATPSPITVVNAETLEQRGINTTQEAVQRLASNNGPALTNSFSANGAFAAGASAVSLRGLSTNSTLVLFDGLRAAYYPLADDATRNFVDLNTIPDDIVDRIEVLRDGASSTYGADAIAGVVNVITKKQITGISGRAEAGISQRGDGANHRLSLTAGWGDLDDQGFNVYISGFYFDQAALYNRDRRYPYNSQNQSGICRDGVCGPSIGPNGGSINPSTGGYSGFSTTTDASLFATTFFVAPAGPDNAAETGRYQFLNPAAGCIAGETPYTLTPQEFAADARAPGTVCQGDLVNQYGVISPNIERWGGSFRATGRITDDIEAYFQANFLQSNVSFTGLPASIRRNGPAGINFPRFSTAASAGGANSVGSLVLALPVYVCPLINNLPDPNCTAANPAARLNPNNPFAAQGQVARILGRIPNIQEYNETRSRTYRAALGVTGKLWDDWDFAVNGVAMRTDLRRTQNGYIYIQNLLNVIADGSYDFVNPYANSQATLDYLSPDNVTDANSQLYAVEATLSGNLFDLPGGPMQIGGGLSLRYESIDAPSANSDVNGPTQRYFVLNAFGTKGHRTVRSAFVELNAPVLESLEINASGRYDDYSSGQHAFSPKVGAKFTPIRQVALRGTWSRGFRIPSFAEANAIPTTGFVTAAQSLYNDAFLSQYGCSLATFNSCPAYISSASYGQTTLASPDLKPERSTSFTAGIVVEPIRNISLSIDYFNIKKTGAITTPSNRPALLAYYAGQVVPSGYNIIADAPAPDFPGATPRVAFVQSQLINANTIRSEGLDFAARAQIDLGPDIRFTSALEASYIINLSTTFPDGTTESYEGTAGNFNLTAGSGTPEWHGNWQNTLEWGKWTVSATAEYFGGYNLSAADQGTEPGDCGLLSAPFVKCDVPAYITVDLTTSFKASDRFTFYINILNLFDDLPPIDPVTYGANNYNPVQGGLGIFGRSFRAGARFTF